MTSMMEVFGNYQVIMGAALIAGVIWARIVQSQLSTSIGANIDGRFWRLIPIYGICTGGTAMIGTMIVAGLDGNDSLPLAFGNLKYALAVAIGTLGFMYFLASRQQQARIKLTKFSQKKTLRILLITFGVAISGLCYMNFDMNDPYSIRQIQWPILYFGAMTPFIMGRGFVWLINWFE